MDREMRARNKFSFSSAKQPTVLVVDPDPFVQRVVRDILEREQINVVSAQDSSEALAVLRSQKAIDLIISEWVLPSCSGRQLAHKAHRRRPYLKTIFVTGLRSVVLQRQELGEGECLQKPFAPDELINRVEPHLSGRRELLQQRKWSA